MKSLNLVLKAEANGSLEALRSQVTKIEDPTVKIKVVGEGVGAVSESDVNLAAVTDAIVIGFNVRPDDHARAAAEEQGVDVRFYDVVYQVTDDIEKAVKGLYQPTMIEVTQGRAEVRRVYQVDGKPAIAGSHVLDGRITRNATCRVPSGLEGDRPEPYRCAQAVQGRRPRGDPWLRLRHHPCRLQRFP